MMRSKPVVALLGLLTGLLAAAAGWKGWQLFTDRRASALAPGDSSAALPPSTSYGLAGAMLAERPAAAGAGLEPPAASPIVEDEESALRAEESTPETAEELADLLPEPALPLTELGNEEGSGDSTGGETTSSTADEGAPAVATEVSPEAEVDRVLEVLAAAEDAREPATVQSRFGPNAFPADEGGVCPPDHPVKGNTNSMIYHLPGQPSYGATMAEVCFADAETAEAAGFRPRKSGGAARH
jgi:hypothetical protein